MLGKTHGPLRTHEFMVQVTLERGRLSPEQVTLKLSDALAWVEGSGRVDVKYVGEIDCLCNDTFKGSQLTCDKHRDHAPPHANSKEKVAWNMDADPGDCDGYGHGV